MKEDLGKYLMLAGLGLLLFGAVVYFFHDKLNWPGRLPGDIRVEKEHFKFYFPITTMVLVSLALSVLFHFFKKLF